MRIKTLLALLFAVATISAFGQKVVRFGVISDVHEDLQKDARERLATFLDDAKAQKVDFAIQLGDLSHSHGADSILKVWNSPRGPKTKYNMLGNHDTDNAPIELMVAKYGMPGSYYAFDSGGVRFLVLETNTIRATVSPEQIEWLEGQLSSSDRPMVIFSHNALDEIGASISNREQIRDMVRKTNDAAGPNQVIALFCGHHHRDAHSQIDGVSYFHINSASYMWVEGSKRYSNGQMAEYRDPVYAFVEIDLKKRTITIEGKQSEFLDPQPQQADFTADDWKTINAGMIDRKVSF